MRLWSLHPKYLDQKGLVALWREGLLAQQVLLGRTRGYKKHPQLIRFKESSNPTRKIGFFLSHIADEAELRGYKFDRRKIVKDISSAPRLITVTTGQIRYEYQHLLKKLKARDRDKYREMQKAKVIRAHPLFRKVRGGIANWERI